MLFLGSLTLEILPGARVCLCSLAPLLITYHTREVKLNITAAVPWIQCRRSTRGPSRSSCCEATPSLDSSRRPVMQWLLRLSLLSACAGCGLIGTHCVRFEYHDILILLLILTTHSWNCSPSADMHTLGIALPVPICTLFILELLSQWRYAHSWKAATHSARL
jgi:hypothetical protein